MQNLKILREEISSVALGYGGRVSIQFSMDRWNPVSNIRLDSFCLPDNISPPITSLRVPIPNLFGFATTPAIVFFGHQLYEKIPTGGREKLAFCRKISEADIEMSSAYLVDMRENIKDLRSLYSFCFSPTVHVGRFTHLGIQDFLNQILEFMRSSPREVLEAEIGELRARCSADPTREGLSRLAYVLSALDRNGEADQVRGELRALFPGAAVAR